MEKITSVLKEYASYNEADVLKNIEDLLQKRKTASHHKKAYETILSCIDLTSLNTSDTEEGIANMVQKVNEFGENYPELPNVAAICVYPSMVKTVRECLTEGVEIASVAAGFPHSQTFVEVKVAETSLAVLDGASEIDIVLSIGKLLEKKYDEIVEELQEIKAACREAHLKVILESGSLNVDQIRIASILSMESGANFIKTSTGKQQPAATTTAAYVMCQLIKEYYDKTGRKVGFKAAGGIATTEEALDYYCIVEEVLGDKWLQKDLFRFGASRLANNILTEIMEKPTIAF